MIKITEMRDYIEFSWKAQKKLKPEIKWRENVLGELKRWMKVLWWSELPFVAPSKKNKWYYQVKTDIHNGLLRERV